MPLALSGRAADGASAATTVRLRASSPRARIVVAIASLAAGSFLFFVAFAAVFNGLVPLLVIVLASYAVASLPLGAVVPDHWWIPPAGLTLPALPLTLSFFVASIPEAGLRRALLWPTGLAVALALAGAASYLGARLFGRARAG